MKHYYTDEGHSIEYQHEEADSVVVGGLLKKEYDRLVGTGDLSFAEVGPAITDYAFSEFRSLYGTIIKYEADKSLGRLSGFVRSNQSENEQMWFGVLDRWYQADMVPNEFMLYANDLLMRSVIDILLGVTNKE